VLSGLSIRLICSSEQLYSIGQLCIFTSNFSSSPLSESKYWWIARRLFWEVTGDQACSFSLFEYVERKWQEEELFLPLPLSFCVELNREDKIESQECRSQIIKIIIITTTDKSYHSAGWKAHFSACIWFLQAYGRPCLHLPHKKTADLSRSTQVVRGPSKVSFEGSVLCQPPSIIKTISQLIYVITFIYWQLSSPKVL
jgi:hypothetical protein